MILADDHSEEPVSYLTLLWIEQRVNTCTNQSEVRRKLETIKYEIEAQELIQEMNTNRLTPGYHYTPHLVEDMKWAVRYMVDKDNLYDKFISNT